MADYDYGAEDAERAVYWVFALLFVCGIAVMFGGQIESLIGAGRDCICEIGRALVESCCKVDADAPAPAAAGAAAAADAAGRPAGAAAAAAAADADADANTGGVVSIFVDGADADADADADANASSATLALAVRILVGDVVVVADAPTAAPTATG